MLTASAPLTPDAHKVELILAQLSSLPTLAPVAVRLLDLTMQSDADLREITELVETDAPLAARLISMLRRADTGVPVEHATVDRAVALLGVRTVRQVVLMTKVLEVFTSPAARREAAFDRREFWKHCLAVGCAARGLALLGDRSVDPDDAFLGGLLHDLGKMALDACVPKSYDRVAAESRTRRTDLLLIERKILGVDHTIAGRRLAERWRLPSQLVECIWLHHLAPQALPPGIHAPALVRTVWLANALVRAYHIGQSGNTAPPMSIEAAAGQAGVEQAVCRQVMESLPHEIEERAGWLGLDDVTSSRLYVEALAESTRELSKLSDDALAQNRRLLRTAEYFRALGELNRTLSARAAPAETCLAAARAIRSALGISAAVVYAREENPAVITIGVSDGVSDAEFIDTLENTVGRMHPDESRAAEAAIVGRWIDTAPPGVMDVADAFRDRLAVGELFLLPILREQQWVAGALLAAPPSRLAHWNREHTELEALCAAAGLAIENALARADGQRLAENLAWAQRQLLQAQSDLAEAQSLRMTAEMAAGAAHELNTPLAIISGRSQLLRQQAAEPKQAAQLDEIVQATHRASDIISELIDFADPRPAPAERVALAGLLEALVRDWARREAPARSITLDPPDAALSVRCNAERLRAAVSELLANAVEATPPESGRIVVRARADSDHEMVEIDVVDNGRGMPPDVRARACDPFFSHRPAGRGRGMGLTRAVRWMSAHGGHITLDAAPDGGTLARIRLPRAED